MSEAEIAAPPTSERRFFRPQGGERPSLPEVHASVAVPATAGGMRKLFAFMGPGYMVSVGYMDPGNWATDLAGGAQFGYTLLFVIMLSNLMAILLQALAARLGIATGRDLAQACRAYYPKPVALALWAICELAIIACDLAEVIGTAIALQLLFGIPLIGGALLTALDAFLVLLLMNKGFRYLEAFVVALLIIIFGCFAVQIFVAAPPAGTILHSMFVPSAEIATNPAMLYIAIGIIGATVMPHNLYLHSSIVQTRAYERTDDGKREAIKWATVDSTIALMLALFVNAAILIVSAVAFHGNGHEDVPNRPGVSVAVAAARPRHRFDAVCGRLARLGPELHGHRHAGRPDRHGRVPAPAPAALGAPPVDARACHRPRRGGDGHLRRTRNRRTAGPQPGDPFHAASLRDHPAGDVRFRPQEDGQLRHPARRGLAGLDCRGPDCNAQPQAALRHGRGHRLMPGRLRPDMG